ncbi:MAG: 30S ribosomal protein S17 [Dehalococcoidia bacterium]
MAKAIFGGRKTREGTVVSDKMHKTVVVSVSSTVQHRLYKKMVRRQKHYMAHDETNEAQLGDRVRIVEARPYSRLKRWRLAEVLIKADRPEVAPEEIDLELLGEVKTEEEAPAAEETVAAVATADIAAEPAAEAPEPGAEAALEEPPAVEEAVAAPEEAPAAEEAVAEPAEEPAPEAPPAETEEQAPEADAAEPEPEAEAPEAAEPEPEAEAKPPAAVEPETEQPEATAEEDKPEAEEEKGS